MKVAAVVIDDWKLPVFKKILDQNNYSFTVHPGVTKLTLTLRVNYELVENLQPIIELCNTECKRCKLH